MQLTGQILKQMMPLIKEENEWANALNKMLPINKINTLDRIANFIAQIGHESLSFKILIENLNYSETGLNKTFAKYFVRAGVSAASYARNPEKIANYVYAGRLGNGPISSGDGWKFRGRGLIQLTGKDNITSFARFINKSIEETLAYLLTKEGAVESACWFWDSRNINDYVDREDFQGATKRINGGANGLVDRIKRYNRAKAALGMVDTIQISVERTLQIGTRGLDVKNLQRKLDILPDGVFGENTKRSLIAWQLANGLVGDGVVGPKTLGKM